MKDMSVEGKRVVAAVSDDPNTMWKYRRLLEEKWPCGMDHRECSGFITSDID